MTQNTASKPDGLTPRELFVLQAALSYTLSNLDELNDMLSITDPETERSEGVIDVCGTEGDPLEDTEIDQLSRRLGIPVSD